VEFLEKLMEIIVKDGVNTPKAQVERYLSPILAIFLEEILKNKFGNKYKMIAPEFPIRKKTIDTESTRPNQSTNIDYLMFNESKNKFTFIELKTDSTSFKLSQLEIYNQLETICNEDKRVFGNLLYEDLKSIKKASSYRQKYQYLIDTKWNQKYNIVNDMEIIYIVPAKTKLKEKQPELQTMYFEDFPKSLGLFDSEYQTINSYLGELDAN
jgi:hypothetical protein